MRFPFTVRIESISTDQGVGKGAVETATTLLASTKVQITQIGGSRSVNDGQDTFISNATITGLAPQLSQANIRLVVLSGPYTGLTAYIISQEQHGPIGSIPAFYRLHGELHSN